MTPLITVCLPVFNGQRFLPETFDSILSQSVQDFEILVPDDCSTDNSFEIVEKYASLDRRIKGWKNGRRLGLFNNYNQCLKNALGTYIKPMAQDDIILPNMLERCVNILSSTKNVSLVSTARSVIDQEGILVNTENGMHTPETWLGKRDVYPKEEILMACLNPLQNIIGEPCTVMFRANAIQDGFSDKLYHLGDLEFWLRILKTGDYAYISEELVKFRCHQGSATNNNIKQLRIPSDIVQIAQLWSSTITEMGSTEKEFIFANLSYFATIVCEEMEAGRFNDEMINNEFLSEDNDYGTKKALLYSLMLVSEKIGYKSIALRNASIIGRSEARLRFLLESFPWCSTRFLRELNRRFKTKNKSDCLDLESSDCDDQKKYLWLLKTQQREILSSNSWKIGRHFLSFIRPLMR